MDTNTTYLERDILSELEKLIKGLTAQAFSTDDTMEHIAKWRQVVDIGFKKIQEQLYSAQDAKKHSLCQAEGITNKVQVAIPSLHNKIQTDINCTEADISDLQTALAG